MTDYTLEDLFDAYKRQRENHVRPDQALKVLVQMQPNLPSHERQKLAQIIRDWELKRQTGQYPKSAEPAYQEVESAAARTQPKPPMPPPPPTPTVSCPHCGTNNPPGAKYCYSCGQLIVLTMSSATGVLPDDDYEDPAIFGNMATLIIHVRDHNGNPLRLQIADRPLIIGRGDPGSALQPDVDLTPYGAKDFGVSRHHATLQRSQNTLTLFDEGSVNHTYINGVKLHPHEVRVVRDGDEVRFGHLMTRFTFQREVRRLQP